MAIKVVLLAAVTGGVVAVVAFFLMERLLPGEVTIGPGSAGEIVVTIDGAVATPGVITLPAGSRLIDAVEGAGGLLDTADTTTLNLAGRIGDGEQITIPSTSEPGEDQEPEPGATPDNGSSIDSAGLIDINTAGVSELDQLPGVGPTIAQRIIDFREFYGPFESVDQLVEVEGISQTMVDEFRHLVTTGG
jgi:competence protein ComEA